MSNSQSNQDVDMRWETDTRERIALVAHVAGMIAAGMWPCERAGLPEPSRVVASAKAIVQEAEKAVLAESK